MGKAQTAKKTNKGETKIKNFDRPIAKGIMGEIELLLRKEMARRGITASIDKVRYSEVQMSMKITLLAGGESGDGAREDFEKHCALVGLSPDNYNQTFNSGGRVFRIKGVNLGRPKYPISAEREDGRKFKFTPEQVKAGLF